MLGSLRGRSSQPMELPRSEEEQPPQLEGGEDPEEEQPPQLEG